MDKNKQGYKVITIAGGNVAVSYLPEIKGTAAVVDLATLIRITRNMPTESLALLKDNLCDKIQAAISTDHYVDIIGKELAFHFTCRKITETDLNLATEAVARAEETDKNPHMEM